MKGLIKVRPQSLKQLCKDCLVVIRDFDTTTCAKVEYKEWSWKLWKKITKTYTKTPNWYHYRKSLVTHLEVLVDNAIRAGDNGDELWLSELSYTHLVKLSKGDAKTNSIYILDY